MQCRVLSRVVCLIGTFLRFPLSSTNKSWTPLNLMLRALSAPSIPLANRAVHPFFLREVLRSGIPPCNPSQSYHHLHHRSSHQITDLSECSEPGIDPLSEGGGATFPGAPSGRIIDLVENFIKPATAASRTSLVQVRTAGPTVTGSHPRRHRTKEIIRPLVHSSRRL